ncbi:putative aldehyde dehydrogenase [Pelagophyceae sp. CCMP2097]|nr:putative aldehyde dehydrogenase [Pelagophyceae sp. CCMP2097]
MLLSVDTDALLYGVACVFGAYVAWKVGEALLQPAVPKVVVSLASIEAPGGKFDLAAHEARVAAGTADQSVVPCWDPATLDSLGTVPATKPQGVVDAVGRARTAQAKWASSTFAQRRQLMNIMLRYIVENQESIARVAVRDSGKTLTDAVFGEILVTCEKLKWLAAEGEAALLPENRSAGTTVMFTKKVHVEYRPLGVVGAIVPWNYPFHNVFNPLSAALFSGNAIVIKVSEYASWSAAGYYGAIIRACLEAAGAPVDLVQIVHGYGATGAALVNGGVDKVIFVGSPGVGKVVMAAAAKTLTPVVLELGGKDPFVVCGDVVGAEMDRVVQVALRGVFQSMGQNCAGPERFFVDKAVYAAFTSKIAAVVDGMTYGSSLLAAEVDCGAIPMGAPTVARLQGLVDDAVSRGAVVLSRGKGAHATTPAGASFFPPTVLGDVPRDARIAQEEIFGPIMCIFKTESDDDAVERANACGFALSSCAFAGDAKRAQSVAARLNAGMSAVNDLEGCTYLSQSLPFGGTGLSGFDRFAGPEGLRGLCCVRSCCVDRFPGLRTAIPAPMQYPSKGKGHVFAQGVVELFYAHGLANKALGLKKLLGSMF